LTASSHLQHLVLGSCQFPTRAWQQIFPPTKCFPELRQLFLWTSGIQVQPLSQADFQTMVSCCPRLDSITLGPHLPVSSATPLQQLTSLTNLKLCASFQDSTPTIAQLTGLQDLALYSRGETDRVTVSGLLQLTVLQQVRDVAINLAASAWDPGLRSSLISDCIMLVDNKVGVSAASPSLSVTARHQHAYCHCFF